MEYRICKNKYGYYKIQKKIKKWFRKKYKWIDHNNYHRFESEDEALDMVYKIIESYKRYNDDWECEGEYF